MAPGIASWRAADDATPLTAWREEDFRALGEVLAGVVRSWEQAWGLPREPADARCGAARTDGATAWRVLGTAGVASAWFSLTSSFENLLAILLCDVEQPESPIASELVGSCRADLLLRLAACLHLQCSATGEEAPGPHVCEAWSGAAEAQLSWGLSVLLNAHAVAVLVGRGCAQSLPGATPAHAHGPLASVADAAAGTPVPLRVHLVDCDLDISTLQDLQVGDVLRMKHPLEMPLTVRDAGGRHLFGGFLARRRGFKAVELVPLDTERPLP